ncbi:MAG TPA: DUF1015 domain-containing protein [Dehalococcoidia bacterium]|nr:DUF1015 domain-containing protein [Dehalococcoidia bacterium]
MAELYPFRAVHYNQSLVKDLSAVICHPYDIITPQLQQELYQRSPYNFVRLEYGRVLPQDTTIDNKDTRSAATLEQWLKEGILVADEVPAIYLHDHYFTYQGREYKRRGMVVCVRLEEWDKMVIRPHEGTLSEPKSDRLSLLWACQANTSPILALFEDLGQQVSSLLTSSERGEPMLSLSSAGGESHCIWAITEPGVVNQICSRLAHQPLYIADGHHRYESALIYQRERLACFSSESASAAFNFVLMELVDFSDPGLIILPPHRLVRGISKSTLDELMAKLRAFFEIEALPLTIPDVWRQVDDLLTGETNQVRLILFGLEAEHLFVLRLRDLFAASQMMPYFHCELYKQLGVSIIDHIILEKLLGVGSGSEDALLGYSYDKQDAVNKVLDQEYQLAFLLKPIKPEVVKAIADVGDRMPRKSTYFYPKLPAGLVFHRLL